MENVLLFITPKSQVVYLQSEFTLRQALEKMKFHRYTSVPIIDKFGKYVGTITEGDILWFLTDGSKLIQKRFEEIKLSDIPRNRDNFAVNASQNITELFNIAVNQNFVPIVDDSNSFIGIITRRNILEYLRKNHD